MEHRLQLVQRDAHGHDEREEEADAEEHRLDRTAARSSRSWPLRIGWPPPLARAARTFSQSVLRLLRECCTAAEIVVSINLAHLLCDSSAEAAHTAISEESSARTSAVECSAWHGAAWRYRRWARGWRRRRRQQQQRREAHSALTNVVWDLVGVCDPRSAEYIVGMSKVCGFWIRPLTARTATRQP